MVMLIIKKGTDSEITQIRKYFSVLNIIFNESTSLSSEFTYLNYCCVDKQVVLVMTCLSRILIKVTDLETEFGLATL